MNTTEMLIYKWKSLPWKHIEKSVFKLQKRIYQASLQDNKKKVRRLQKLLIKSWTCKCLAVRRVSQDNGGKKTAGVDGVKSLTPKQRMELVTKLDLKQKASPVRRVWIPKPGKQEKRPLGIPTMRNRALQMLDKLALEPEWEAKFEPNTYGFRPGRATHDAKEAIFNALCLKPKYVLDADIEKCFDRINHQKLLDKLNTFPSLRKVIKKWLKAGILDGKELYPSNKGVPQGGVCSPLLTLIALHGLETAVKKSFPTLKEKGGKQERWRPQVIVYADDLVIMHPNLKGLMRAKEIAEIWLEEMGLHFKAEKTRITHSFIPCQGNKGFDFLGFNVNQYESKKKLGFKTIIKPSKDGVQRHLDKIRTVFKWNKHASQEELIDKLNPIITGWVNYYSTSVSSKIFSKLDYLMWQKLRSWCKRKHPKNNWKEIIRKYFRDGWKFKTPRGKELKRYSSTYITRHIKVKGSKSFFDGDLIYWSTRMGQNPLMPKWKAILVKKQKGKCNQCKLFFKCGDLMEIDHIISLSEGGKRTYSNLQLLHKHCHDIKTVNSYRKF